VIVPDYQLSLAIGKEGQNARLAHKLTGWKIDIHSDNPGGADQAPRRPSAEHEGGARIGPWRPAARPECRSARRARYHGCVGAVSLRAEWPGDPCPPRDPDLRSGLVWDAGIARPSLTCCAWSGAGMRLSPTRKRGCLVGAPMCIRARHVSSKHNVGVGSAGRSG